MCTKLCLSGHTDLLASGLLEQNLPDILLASENGEYLETSRILLVSSSNMFAKILSTQPTADCIILPDVPFRQVQLMVDMLQQGSVISDDSQQAMEAIGLAKQLQVPGTFSLVKEERIDAKKDDEKFEHENKMEEEEVDDVFQSYHQQQQHIEFSLMNNNHALDLSPSSRLTFNSSNEKHFSFEFPQTESTNSKSNTLTVLGSRRNNSLQRNRKPPPLKYLTSLECGAPQPSVQTPWTPLAASPVIEETFKKIVQQQKGKEVENEEKLRNLSVSSADFESCTPNTPNHTKDHSSNSGKLPGKKSDEVESKATAAAQIDHAYYCVDVKTEPDQSSSNSLVYPEVKISPPEQENVLSPPEHPDFQTMSIDNDIQRNNTLPQLSELSSPAMVKNLSPIQQILLLRQQELIHRNQKSEFTFGNSVIRGSDSSGESFDDKSNIRVTPETTKYTPKPHKSKAPEGEGKFKCEKCGKSYNWNYNLNRHMRFECGIGHRFQCGLCKRRFPHKQNAAIHLKRKHLLKIDSAEEMLASGHIELLSNILNMSSN